MRDDDALPISTPTSSSVSGIPKQDHPANSIGVFGRGRYKFWALAAILLLAFWSMVTGTVTLRWSAGNLIHVADDYHFRSTDDLDVLDLEEREKMVKRMWDEYANSQRIRLAGFWQEAFVAAYEDLTSEVPEVRQAAVSEIARMSALYIKLDPPPLESSISLKLRNSNQKEAEHTSAGDKSCLEKRGTSERVSCFFAYTISLFQHSLLHA